MRIHPDGPLADDDPMVPEYPEPDYDPEDYDYKSLRPARRAAAQMAV